MSFRGKKDLLMRALNGITRLDIKKVFRIFLDELQFLKHIDVTL